MFSTRNSSYKPIFKEDEGLDLIPSSLELALNGNESLYSPSKSADGLLGPESFRRLSAGSDYTDSQRAASPSCSSTTHIRSLAPPAAWRRILEAFWQRNRGLWLVAISQLFGALMNVTTRLLELEGEGMGPFQILLWRMGMTMVICCIYMWWKNIPDFPLGPRDCWGLLVARGFSGFFGIFGMYYSLQYLPLADATVITFLAPAAAGYACYLLIGERFTRTEQIASAISLLGVVLIARPFGAMTPSTAMAAANNGTAVAPASDHDFNFPDPTTAQRLSAIAVALLGVLGSAGAYTTIRWIGKRAHPLISVNYFATWCTIVSLITLSIGSHLPEPYNSPSLRFALPASPRQWFQLLFLGICGFVMQFLLTAGMSHEKGNRATNMVYTNMLFALAFDRWVFDVIPGMWSLAGCGLILGSAVWVAIGKSAEIIEEGSGGGVGGERSLDEEMGVLMLEDEEEVDTETESLTSGNDAEPNDIRL